MAQTYMINEGVRRAKAADLAGHRTIWAQVGQSTTETKVPVDSLPSPKKVIDVRAPRELVRWQSIERGMSEEPDLLPPIHVLQGSRGVPIRQVTVVGEPA
jgi:hypothetical protein